MSKLRVSTSILSAVLLLTLVSSVRADVVRADKFLETLINAETHDVTVTDFVSVDTNYLYAETENSNGGKYLGFSIAAVDRGPKLGLVRPLTPTVSQNPEPTAMVLLGTGLAAVAALARKKSRRRRL